MSEKEANKAAEQAQDNAELNDEELEQAAGGLSVVGTGCVQHTFGEICPKSTTGFYCPQPLPGEVS